MRPTLPTARDLPAAIGVALVLVPQSLAYAELAGMPPGVGLLVATVAGLSAAVAASSPYLQTGPVAITALLTFGALAPLAEPASARYVALAATLAVLVGLIRLVIGWSRSGYLAYFMSDPVMVGFTAAAALVIIATQVPLLLGVDGVTGGPIRAAAVAVGRVGAWDGATVAVAVLVTSALLLGRWLAPRFPMVIVVVAGSIAATSPKPMIAMIRAGTTSDSRSSAAGRSGTTGRICGSAPVT